MLGYLALATALFNVVLLVEAVEVKGVLLVLILRVFKILRPQE